VAIEGATQSGKTVLLSHMARQLIAANQGAVVIMDPKGSDHLDVAARQAAACCGRPYALIRPRTPSLSARFNVISSCEEPTDLPGRLRPLFPEGREAYFTDEPLALMQRVAAMHRRLGITWDIRHLHRDIMDLTALRWTLIQYLNTLGAGFEGLQRDRLPGLERIKKRYGELGSGDPLVPGVLRPLERTQEAHQDRFGNLDIALSGIVDVDHADLFGAQDALTWQAIDQAGMVVVFRTDSLVTRHIGRHIASLFFQDFMGYMGLRYLSEGTRRTPITLLIDEVGEIVYPDFRQAINKVGEAGGRLILAWQTEADLDAALGKYEADVIRANCQTRLTLRLADGETADTIAKRSPRVRVTRPTSSRAMAVGGRAGQGITVEDEEMPLLEANLLQAQPAGQGFLRLDGSLYHINMPH
jgi:conjugal transfer pilus assembly protein TraD